MSRKKKAKTPQEIAADLDAHRARKREVDNLKRQPDLRVKATPDHHLIAVERLDVFALLFDRKSLTIEQYQAVRRLEREQAIASGAEKSSRPTEFVQSSGTPDGPTQAMLDAGALVREILANCGGVNARLLTALTAHQAAIFTRWRATVEKVTGETRPECQSAAIRSACANLSEAWVAFDYRKRAA